MGLKTSMSRALSFAHLEARGRAQDDDGKPGDDDDSGKGKRSKRGALKKRIFTYAKPQSRQISPQVGWFVHYFLLRRPKASLN